MTDYPAPKLTLMALHWMRSEYPHALLTTELSIGKYGAALIDVAAITERDILGIEIKGDGDSPSRLARQGWVYSRSASKMWLLAAPSIKDRVAKHRPPNWAWLNPEGDGLNCPHPPYGRLPNSPAALLEILWKDELLAVAGQLTVNAKRRWNVDRIADLVAETATLETLRPAVCQALLDRDWMRLLQKKVYRPGDALPETSPIRETENE